MAKIPTNLSLHQRILELAATLQDRLGYNNLSTMVEGLIRAEYEKRIGSIPMKEEKYPTHRPQAHIGADDTNSSAGPGSPADSDGTRAETALVAEGKAAEQEHQAKLKPDLGGYAKRRRAVRGAKKK